MTHLAPIPTLNVDTPVNRCVFRGDNLSGLAAAPVKSENGDIVPRESGGGPRGCN
jgi:hypothetical protein